jgi:phosphate-selective porin OprO/OprP
VAYTHPLAARRFKRARLPLNDLRRIALRRWFAAAILATCVPRTAPAESLAYQADPLENSAELRPNDPAPSDGDGPVYYAQNPEPLPPTEDPQAAIAPEMQAILDRLDAVEAELAATKAAAAKDAEKSGKADDKKADAKPKEKDPLDGWTDLSNDKWTLKLGGHVQLDWINWADKSSAIAADPLARDYFEFRRARLLADGNGYGVYDFRLMLDAEPESGDGVTTPVVDVKDAYFSLNELPGNQRWRIGNFFVPFSLEQVTNDTMNIFLERSIPTQGVFAADREVGMALYGISDAKDFTWTGGAFFDSISESLKERVDNNEGQRLSGRLTWLPYYDEPSNGRYLVHTGCGVLYTHDQDNAVRFRARPQIHEGPFIIDSLNLNANSYTTGNLELATVWGPVSVQSEAFLSNVNFNGGPDRQCYGAYVYGSWFLTGENRIYERFGQHGAQFGRSTPFTNVFWVPGCHGLGAWEAKCRWSNLSLQEVSRGVYNDITCGFNWYWSDRVRFMFDWIHPITDTVGGATPFGDATADIIGTRFDFNW